MCVHKAILGTGPAFEDVYIGQDGQLWQWDEGQVVIAKSGEEALEYAQAHGWPDNLLARIKTASEAKR